MPSSTTPPLQMPPRGGGGGGGAATPPYRHLQPPPFMKHPGDVNVNGNGNGNFSGPYRQKQSQPLLRPHRRTNPLIWCGAILCVIFSLLLILAGILTLVVFLLVKPRTPTFEISGASLNAIYLDSPTYLNADVTFLANFSNPNTKMDVAFEYLSLELYYRDRLVAAQGLGPFLQRRQQTRLESVHMISSEVFLPVEAAMQVQKEMRSNRVGYSVRGRFKVRASFGIAHVSYWVYGSCLLQMTAPPGGVLVARSCRTRRG